MDQIAFIKAAKGVPSPPLYLSPTLKTALMNVSALWRPTPARHPPGLNAKQPFFSALKHHTVKTEYSETIIWVSLTLDLSILNYI